MHNSLNWNEKSFDQNKFCFTIISSNSKQKVKILQNYHSLASSLNIHIKFVKIGHEFSTDISFFTLSQQLETNDFQLFHSGQLTIAFSQFIAEPNTP
jgi:hypothetical protein